MQFIKPELQKSEKDHLNPIDTIAPLSFLENPDPSLDDQHLLHSLFERSATSHAERTALECRPHRLSYAELDAKANPFARFFNRC